MTRQVGEANSYCLFNGQAISESTDSHRLIHDRGLHYGDGVFRTLAVFDNSIVDLAGQLAKLQQDAEALGMIAPFELLAEEANQLAKLQGQGALKILLTFGTGLRGYARSSGNSCNRILIAGQAPANIKHRSESGARTLLCETRLGQSPRLAGIKHLNRLEQVLARAEWDSSDIDEGLMLDTDGNLISGVQSNLFLVHKGIVQTAELTHCGIRGRMRERIIELATSDDIRIEERNLNVEDLQAAEEVFVSNSLIGACPVILCQTSRQVFGEWQPGSITRKIQRLLAHPMLS